MIIRTDSRRAALRCHAGVIALSTAVMHFDALFLKFFTPRVQVKREDPGIHPSPGKADCRIKSGDHAV
jgi:hypothetical protein